MIQFETLIGIEELSKELGINKYTIYKKMRENRFPKGIKINGKRMFKPDMILNYYKDLGISVKFTNK